MFLLSSCGVLPGLCLYRGGWSLLRGALPKIDPRKNYLLPGGCTIPVALGSQPAQSGGTGRAAPNYPPACAPCAPLRAAGTRSRPNWAVRPWKLAQPSTPGPRASPSGPDPPKKSKPRLAPGLSFFWVIHRQINDPLCKIMAKVLTKFLITKKTIRKKTKSSNN